MAFGILAKFASTSAPRAPLGIALGAMLMGHGGSCARSSRAAGQLRAFIARRRRRDALADLDDRSLGDIGVLREPDIGGSRAAARAAAELFRRP
jgi:uncharacterized protein YjiS (DUF1127 family)